MTDEKRTSHKGIRGIHGVRLDPKHQERTRSKIRVEKLLKLLQDNAFGIVELDPVRQRSAEICLRKALPDLSATEITGSVASYVARLPEPARSVEDWTASLDKPLLTSTPVQHERDTSEKDKEEQ